jgi:hypothetical protein
MATRPAIFKWRQSEPQLILCAVRWYLRLSLQITQKFSAKQRRTHSLFDRKQMSRVIGCRSPKTREHIKRTTSIICGERLPVGGSRTRKAANEGSDPGHNIVFRKSAGVPRKVKKLERAEKEGLGSEAQLGFSGSRTTFVTSR